MSITQNIDPGHVLRTYLPWLGTGVRVTPLLTKRYNTSKP
jgi:hypothetical protein